MELGNFRWGTSLRSQGTAVRELPLGELLATRELPHVELLLGKWRTVVGKGGGRGGNVVRELRTEELQLGNWIGLSAVGETAV